MCQADNILLNQTETTNTDETTPKLLDRLKLSKELRAILQNPKNNLKQKDIAQETGLNASTISKFLNPKNIVILWKPYKRYTIGYKITIINLSNHLM